jgi:hypothetical protein
MTRRLIVAALIGVAATGAAFAQNNAKASLDGYQENPSISTTGTGTLDLQINDAAQIISYTLQYANLEGVAPHVTDGVVTASHIHVAAPGVNGGVSAFLCGGGGKPSCPLSGTVTGTIVAADVIGPAGQGVESESFAELVRAIRAGFTYVNVHTTRWTGGEIRGQIK